MGLWSLRDPHSRGDIQTRISEKREAHGGEGRWAGRAAAVGGVPKDGSGHRTTAWLGLSPH